MDKKLYHKQSLYHLLIASLISLLSVSLAYGGNKGTEPDKESYSIRLIKGEKVRISPYLTGFNAVYAYESDAIWNDGKIVNYLKDVSTSVMRYPGGTVSSFYHWDKLTGEGWKDSWDPVNQVIPKDKSEFMDLDEFISVAQRTNVTPLIGINMSSARRWNRLEDGIREALNLMKYCRDKNFKVKYWYLDNEPYQPDSNGGSKTIEEYAMLVNLFASRMREFDKGISIIVNWKSSFRNTRNDYQKLLSIAGSNIDIIDGHWYWSWSNPTFQKWLMNTPMEVWTGESYIEEIAYFRQMVKEFGYPGIKLASLEWNVGPIKGKQLTPHQCALIQSEMLMQFMSGGLDMATFWPLQGAGGAVAARSFVQRSDRSALPFYGILKFLGKFQGSSIIRYEVVNTHPNVSILVATDESEKIIRVCLLNKDSADVRIDVVSDLFKKMKLTEGSKYILENQGTGSNILNMKLMNQSRAGISFNVSPVSVTMLTFNKK